MPSELLFPQALKNIAVGESGSVRIFKSGPATWAMTVRALLNRGRNVVLVAPGAQELDLAAAHMRLFSRNGRRDWAALPGFRPGSLDVTAWSRRWSALYDLALAKGPSACLMSADNLLPKWPPKDILATHHLELGKGEEFIPESILEQAVYWGYERVRMVTRPGEMAMRGDILDIFAPGAEKPLRLEFFGDTLTEIRRFDPVSQRSHQELDSAVILPMAPAVTSPDLAQAAREKWAGHRRLGEMPKSVEQELGAALDEGRGDMLPGQYYEDASLITDWLPRDAVWVLCGADKLRSRLEEAEWAWNGFIEEQAEITGWRRPRSMLFQGAEAARKSWLDRPQVLFEDLVMGDAKNGLDLAEKTIHAFDDLFWKPEDKNRPWQALMAALKRWSRERPQVLLSFRTENSRKRFLKLAEQDGILPYIEYSPGTKGIYALISPVRKGAELSWNGALILSEDVLQPVKAKARTTSDKDFKGLDRYDELTEGDLLVHRDFGLARFDGLTRMEAGKVAGDYLLLSYQGDDRLYLPVDRLNLIQRYKGPEGADPSLDKLGGPAWRRAKDKARKAIEKIAAELVEMYAYRQVAKGFSYDPADDLYREFEASFGFEETPDQERAIAEVLADMEKPTPMDRLVCGDVGFGKTEVAMRAAMRAALNGKQTAIMCPTTVLAEQHFQTFSRRLTDFPVTVGMVSRFVPRKRQKEILAAAERGEVDILIGTHRLLSGDVSLPNLGLLVLDEEQRFGVKAKEKLKHFRKNIDVLALTATPIPRTLQLSLSGIRQLSLIETPPEDRKAVQTSIMEHDDKALGAILKREMERGGQVFWVHNRVQSLPRVAEHVRSLAGEARVGMAHGQMKERELEETMHAFWHGELDVLVCTAIVESGLDFPRANTLVVDNAQMFGLGQLYQIRGRVGRSERQAYAYFVIPDARSLPETARKRLQVILEMDYLGAGFQIAREDLRLRGAGNILGEVQSGSIARVGLDLFMEMLAEEVARVKGEQPAQATEPELGILFEARIPDTYLPDPHDRLRYYKALSSARDDQTSEELMAELKDRFGPPPEEALRFVEVLRLKRILSRLQAERADLYPNRVVVNWNGGGKLLSPERVIAWVNERSDLVKMSPPAKIELRIPEKMSIRDGMQYVAGELRRLLEQSDEAKIS